ncbi:MAG: UDP-N-acetyl-D-glucosamine/UDP-N-acetyl-D-galactosamine dehydrogenase [Gammaproteobacteria bacterium]|jgi:UDP-N-acetyl-D-galactosamine dehydrogenase|nr:UDP-N-acetyl-D-glucosamine/UDP-N-acetyl-D-galactosamine dehydrogenase [Gammaproteobacteria bacterium]
MRGLSKHKIAIIGLGYVGLPLAVEFGKKYRTVGFDINAARIKELKAGRDSTLETTSAELKATRKLKFSAQIKDLKSCDVFIVTVPTPIDQYKRPDLTPLLNASETVGRVLKKGDIVIYESTVYPGCTEEVCVPVLERVSSLRFNKEFYCGYSPERINPGDKQHRLTTIKKVTSGSMPRIADLVNALYASIITAGTHQASSIKVAEAAKVIENTQRDVNIALINELALIFKRIGIDTEEVLRAAGTKWNFLPFRPGLVGGHCIGVDPYYLTHKATEIGYHPEMILAGRRINDGMGAYVAQEIVMLMTERRIMVADSKILILGLAFKENCPDLRNSKVVDIFNELKRFDAHVDVYDPWVDADGAYREYGIRSIKTPKAAAYDAIVLAVGHDEFKAMGARKIRQWGKKIHVLYDVKYLFSPEQADGRL